MHYFYILYSASANRYYVGETYDLELRLEKHNDNGYKASFTKMAKDWKVALNLESESKESASMS